MSAKPDQQQRLLKLKDALRKRHLLFQGIRHFFAGRDFLEIDTPIRIPAPALEEYIDAEPSGSWYLRTSPELHMKQLLAAGYDRIFQLGPCFRQGERGRQHLPEFTMLEWYRANADYKAIFADTQELVINLAQTINQSPLCEFRGHHVNLTPPWDWMTVDDAFAQYASGHTPESALECGEFDTIMVEQIEPNLGLNKPLVLADYPIERGALARPKADNPNRAERWELYIAGLELANTYSELTNAQEQRKRFQAAAEMRRNEKRDVYPVDEVFMNALETGMPPSGGIALGVDRLLMILNNADTIDSVVPFIP